MPVTIHGTRDLNINDLRPHPQNPNRGDVEALTTSLNTFGQYRAIVALTDGTILAGHHLWKAARANGHTTIRVEVIDCDEQTARKILIADNRLADLGPGVDPELLLTVLNDLDILDGSGYNADDLALLEQTINPPEPNTDPDDAPPLPDKPVRTAVGQTWHLGPHRLYVGSSTNTEAVQAMLAGDTVDCIWTDPPYGVDYVGKTKDALTISNDTTAGLGQLLTDAFTTAATVARPGAPVYVAHAATEHTTFEAALNAAGITVRQQLVWVKNQIILGRSDYHWQHEPILYGFTASAPGVGRLGRGSKHWQGNNSASTVLHVDKPNANADHPTMKPVDLIAPLISNSCPAGGVVLDLFAGSGSTLAAAFMTGRRAALIELDPRYADVIVTRWEALSGETAEQVA
ncbi:DNA modification methylase [Rhodococcus sp. AD45-ID]|uniref:DNA modification methylase n=1 Tax=unclassified Rhodococcus (in: high G+C Gram-positive bacteria) TaxID=192944 RepID=UPI0005D4658A|nr:MULTISPECIES: DNA methyltransferase [unclassified Rhodococcus (in: high G+C Gram-positive bacteria)]KJF21946.1 DNA adenine methyltransferase YhdJ [Rhodococcus sp. AD45]PSR39643.1 DNA modification methylase [Rhodococcus sp. AD45-ID]